MDSGPPQAAELRRKAEERLRTTEGNLGHPPADADARALVHELQVHQIELEMQNEELLRAQAAAVEASEKYYDLFDFAPVGYFLWDHEGRILEVNLAGAALVGLDRGVLVQKRFGQFLALECRAAFADFCTRVLSGDAKQTCEAKILKESKAVDVLIEGVAARDLPGQPRHCRAAVVDITQQKRANELAAANQALVEAKAAAEAANVAKSQFLANMSHELRTPMNAVMGMVDLALDEELSPTLRDYLQTAKQSADGLLQLVNEILDLSRIEAGAFQLESAPFDLRKTLDQVVKTLGVRAYEKGLELLCDLGDVPTQLLGDPFRLRQVLVNLVGNAVKFTSQGAVIVSAKAVPPSPSGRGAEVVPPSPSWRGAVGEGRPDKHQPPDPTSVTLQFAVADTGVGIAPLDQERIFAPFTQADASTTRQFGGTGLGLTIARRLVDLMGGRIWLQSEPGKGSIFHFTVRLGLQEAQEEEPGPPAALGEALRGLPVLVVAGNPALGRILVETLRRWSAKPETAEDASAALAKIQQAAGDGQSFRLILADAVMPGLDGFTLAQRLQSGARLAGAVILMLSAPQRHRHAKRCQDLGALCLEKPVSQSDLLNLIAEALGIRQQAVQAADAAQAAISPVASRSLRVLLAEDTPANQKLAGYLLRKRGHRVKLVRNGRQALEAVGRQEFDAVLMDVQMPVMDGLQATRAIRKLPDPKKARLPIIAMTAHALKGDHEQCLAAGMDGYIAKPIEREELIAMVEQLAEKATAGLSAPAAAPDASASPSPPPIGALPPAETASPPTPPGVFDLNVAVRRCFGKYRLFQDMVKCLFDEADPLLERMRTASANGGEAELANAAHRLKGTVGYLGAAPAMEAVRRVEQMGRRGELTGAAEAIRQLEEQLAILKQAITPYRPAAGEDSVAEK